MVSLNENQIEQNEKNEHKKQKVAKPKKERSTLYNDSVFSRSALFDQSGYGKSLRSLDHSSGQAEDASIVTQLMEFESFGVEQ